MWDPLADEMLAERPFCYTLLPPRGAGNSLPTPITALSPASVAQNMARGPSLAMGSLVGSARFNGTNAAYGRTDNAAFSAHAGANGIMSIACLINVRAFTPTTGSWLVAKTQSGLEFALGIDATGHIFIFYFTSAGATVMTVTSSRVLTLGRTYLVGAEYDRAAPRLALVTNGAQEVSTSASGNTSDTAASLAIGQRADGTRWYNGDMSHLGFYNRPLGAGVWQRWTDLALHGRTNDAYAA